MLQKINNGQLKEYIQETVMHKQVWRILLNTLVLILLLNGFVCADTGVGLSNSFTIDNSFIYNPTELPDDAQFGGFIIISGSDADPVNTATGNFYHSETDLKIATRSMPLEFTRHYNNKDSRSGPLGPGWTHSYNIVLTDTIGEGGDTVFVRWGDGRTDYWVEDGMGHYEPNIPGLFDELDVDSINWTVTKKNLDVYTFDSSGKLTSITDKNGNTFTLNYNVSDQLESITEPAGRTLTLSYNPDGTLASITDNVPRTVHYSYTSGQLTQVTDVLLGNTISYTYDGNGHLDSIIDQRGVPTVTNIYDVDGRVTQQTDGNGNITTFDYGTEASLKKTTITYPDTTSTDHLHSENNLLLMIRYPQGSISYAYDDDNNRTHIVDRNGNVINFDYDTRGNVIAKMDPNDPGDVNDGGISVFAYNDSRFPDFPTSKTDALGNITTWEYDANGNCTCETDPNLNETSWTYNPFGQKLTENDKNSNITTYVYDTDGRLTETINAESNHTWFGYDSLWRLTRVTDGRGSSFNDPSHTTVMAYDPADRITSVTGPLTSTSYQYDEIGNKTHETNPLDRTTEYEYDDNSNLRYIRRPAPAGQTQTIEYTYNELDRKITMTDPNGQVTQYQYDDLGRLITEIDPEMNQTTWTYDWHGNITSKTDGSGVTISYQYDALNRLITQSDELDNTQSWEYDKLGRMTNRTDAAGNHTQYHYDVLGRLTSVTDHEGRSTNYEYDAMGNITLVQDTGGRTIYAKQYDDVNRMVQKTDGNGNISTYSYDPVGNMISRTDANVNTITYTYDNENRLEQKTYPVGSVSYTYDDNGNLLTVIDSTTGTATFEYDELDRLTSSTDSYGKQVTYAYDITNNRTGITYPADSTHTIRTVTYAYDSASRLDTITDWDSRIWDYDLDGAGKITQLTYPNGVKKKQTYDPSTGRLASLAYEKSDATPLISYSYTRDPLGNPINVTETGTMIPDLTTLTKSTTMTFDNDNRLTASNTDTYGYDNNGNVTSIIKEGKTTTLTYNYENRLTSQATAGSTVQHTYNGIDKRIARGNNGTEIRYILDYGRNMSHILCETDSAGEITAYYIHGPEIIGRVAADDSARYYHTDAVGSVVALTDDTETKTDEYGYTSFGMPAGSVGTTSNPFTYVGGLGVMSETDGIYFIRARFYEPDSGRFLSKDPVKGNLTDPTGLPRYVYVINNPISYTDPKGEIPFFWHLLGESVLNFVNVPLDFLGLDNTVCNGEICFEQSQIIRDAYSRSIQTDPKKQQKDIEWASRYSRYYTGENMCLLYDDYTLEFEYQNVPAYYYEPDLNVYYHVIIAKPQN